MTRYTGGCACGAVRFATEATPVVELHCHCRDCQRRSGTGHGSYITFPRRSEVTLTGTAREWLLAGDSGAEKVHGFCPTCGTPVWLTFPAAPELIAVHAGGLDDPALFRPAIATYVVRRPAWDVIDLGLTTFDRMPG